ncbi:MAG: 2-C-methyl-D-erythritol 4-phosphate cytidylyltransferase [Bacteroidales bacterium]
MKRYAILVAGGKGLRMGQDLPKQFIPLRGEPILMRSIRRFHESSPDLHIIVVLPVAQQDYWKELCENYQFNIEHLIANGGETRYHSVKNGLALTEKENAIIAIHDGVRPFVSEKVIHNSFCEAEAYGTAIPVIPMIDSIRHLTDGKSISVPRDHYVLVQTPQVFRSEIIHSAYHLDYSEQFTDDASVAEANGVTIHTVPGNRENIKITTPFDLKIAEVL